MKQLLAAAIAALGFSYAFADEPNTWWVAKEDANASDELVAGRGTEALPFRTIQAALDNPDFVAGDTVLVKPGEYDEGATKATGNYQGSNRVTIAKSVYLKAYDTSPVGRATTRIIGKMGTTSSAVSYCGTDCIRCIRVLSGVSGAVVEGFTLKDGCAFYSDSGGAYSSRECCLGGGIYAPGQDAVAAVDCAFDNCIAAYGGTAIYNGMAIRCEMRGCKVRRLGLMTGTLAFSCLVRNCGNVSSTSDTHIVGTGTVAVGCTFVGNNIYGIRAAGGEAYNCIFEKNRSPYNVEEGAATNDCYVSDVMTNDYFATGFADYSLLDGSPAIGVGQPVHKQVLFEKGVPEAYLERDLAGKTIDWSAIDLNAGAFMATAVPLTGRVTFSADTYVDGRLVEANEWICSETFPAQCEIRPADESKVLFGYSRTQEGSSVKNIRPYFVHPDANGVVRILLPHNAVTKADQTYTPRFVGKEIWVDPSSVGSDDAGDGSADAPYQTLQKAVDAAAEANKDYTLIHARRGDYREGGRAYGGLMTRVDMTALGSAQTPVKIVAEDGPSVTTIWGAADPETLADPSEPGCGANAVRCVAMRAYYTSIQGFTLRDGHTLATSAADASASAKSGAAVYGYEDFWRVPPFVMDCVITNCVAAGDIVHHCFTLRSRLAGNVSTGPIFDFGFHSADLVVNNRCASIFGETDGCSLRAFLMTCHGNEKSPGADAFVNWKSSKSNVGGSIFVKGAVTVAAGTDVGNVVWEQESVSKLKTTSVCDDPILVAPGAGDYRPANASPACGFFDPLDFKTCTEYLAGDLGGRPLRISADGKLTSGCLQQDLPTAVVVAGTDNALLVDGRGGTALTNIFEEGMVSLTVSANEQGVRYAKGFTLNGVEHLFTSYPGSETIAFSAGDAGYRIEPIVTAEWYVDATSGNDANNGFAVATAKKTLAEVFTNCAVRAGDTVYALPGTYDEGEMRVTAASPIACRAVVPESVTLKAKGSADETIVMGAASPDPIGKYGQGTNAVRCVALRENAVVEGITLTGGRTMTVGVEGNKRLEDGNGAGAYGIGENTSSQVRYCVISNNVAAFGGGGAGSTYVGCRIYDNRATDSGNGAALYRTGNLYDCVIEKNSGSAYVVMYPGQVHRCSIGYNGDYRSVYYYQPGDKTFRIFNSVIGRPGNNAQVYWNCVVYTNSRWEVSAARLAAGNSVGVSSFDDLKLDENLRPLKDSPTVDAGDDDQRGANFPETDPDGVPRVLNGGRFDVGAFEYDWRIDYAKDLGPRIHVTNLSSNVVENADGKVEIPQGFLKLDWQSRGKPFVFKALVAGEGTLAVSLNGVPFATATETDELKEFRLPETLDLTKLEFVFTGSGSATLADFRRDSGALLLVR